MRKDLKTWKKKLNDPLCVSECVYECRTNPNYREAELLKIGNIVLALKKTPHIPWQCFIVKFKLLMKKIKTAEQSFIIHAMR